MTAASALRELSRIAPAIAPRHLFEIAGVHAGVRECARVVVPRSVADVVSRAMRNLRLEAGRPSVWNDVVRTSGEDRFCTRRPISAEVAPNATVSLMVARDRTTAERAQRIDDMGTADECGHMLGYPPCCVAGYSRIEAGEDWLDLLRRALPDSQSSLPIAANALEGLFSRSTLHPDFFPCALGCAHAMRFVCHLLEAGLSCGLDEEHASGTERMRGQMALLAGATVRLGRGAGDTSVHVRPGLDSRWSAVLAQPGISFQPVGRGLLVTTVRGQFATAGATVHFE